MLYLSYINLTPGLECKYCDHAHHSIIAVLRKHSNEWTRILEKHPDFNIGLIIATKKDMVLIEVKGPSISKKLKRVDFSIFLPQDIDSMKHYLDIFFEGLNIVFKKYNVVPTEGFQKDIQDMYKTLVK